MIGRVHSIETCGTVDGPGIRFILFMQGCPLRCQYCHNPDSWKATDGQEMDTNKLIKEIVKYKPYMNSSGGGITISGGEPLLQADFVADLFQKCKAEGIHTCIDTSGFVKLDKAAKVLDYTDLVLLDVKSFNPQVYKNVTGVELAPTLEFERILAERNIPVWLRYVLVPNLTDNLDDIEALAKYLTTLSNVERIDVLPFHKMGEFKWSELGYEYKLTDTQEPSAELVNTAKSIFHKYNLPIFGLASIV
ncbi:MAG: pyruvate formate-lyase 1-activating enzyme [Epulopiscium sp. Nele67-Bin001]|nr:MAG: pyruvate formate-lyase 1-activating enzyme [Epulopiscium sp. Nuni2H_MBin001]OON92677.1 MAG: pyruvate formate-lyase 1-activating enzyme [Epulopiscium sp. Nele67-Bin001]